jgi:LCP family protein required for cell wall assembly
MAAVKNPNTTKKGLPLLFTITITIVFLLGGLALFGLYLRMNENIGFKKVFGRINIIPTQPPFLSTNINVAILGYGGAGHDGGNLTDTLILAKVDPIKKQASLISIPRDIWVELPLTKEGMVKNKINSAFAYGVDDDQYKERDTLYKGKDGGGNLAKYAIQKVTGLPVDYYVAINFEGFKHIIDILGGVEIDIPYTFDDYFYPVKGLERETCGKTDDEVTALTATMSGELLEKQFPCRYQHLHFEKGASVLNGEDALKFVRSRHSAVGGSDFGRSQRQQALISAVKDEILALRDPLKIVAVVSELAKNITTDINLKAVYNFAKRQEGISDIKINTISLNDENVLIEGRGEQGQFILLPKNGEGEWEDVHAYIKLHLEKIENPTLPSPSPTPLRR